ncbi:MAG: hypothetical protein SF051_11130 [Elusimicrobiota bacterium]|nr:hypothetical protein [Elusimicrobiota bacterium]
MDPMDPEEAARRKKTLLLLAGGALSLVLPLLGVFYLRWKESREVIQQKDAAGVFQQREGERRIVPSNAPAMAAAVALGAPAQAPSAPPPPVMTPLPGGSGGGTASGGSLGFIKPSDDYFKDKPAEVAPPKKEEPVKAAPPPEEPKPAPKTAKTKPGKKPFVMPKLNTTKGFTSFKRNQPGAQAPDDAGDDTDMSEMLKNLPPGAANNPDIQKMLQQR